jgi:hypothetical protein
LATIKAKSEALRLRQEFELEKFRAKYRAAQGTGGDSPAGHRDVKDQGAEQHSEEAFDEPLKVRASSSSILLLRWPVFCSPDKPPGGDAMLCSSVVLSELKNALVKNPTHSNITQHSGRQ